MADVFISYSRRDIEPMSRLCDGLRNRGKTVFVDVGERLSQSARTPTPAPPADGPAPPGASATTMPAGAAVPGRADMTALAEPRAGEAGAEDPAAERARAEISGIPPSARWMDEIRAAIAASDNIIVAISPDSCASTVCAAELDYAVELNKRLIPILVRDTPEDQVPPSLRALNWLPINAGQSFDSDVDRLVDVLDTDVEGLHLHTRLTVRSNEWAAGGQDRSLLLRGKELETAEQWLTAQADRKPKPTSGQTAYLVASRAAATRRQRGAITVGLVLTLVMAGLTIFAGFQWHSAVVQRKAAITERDIAVSRALAAQSGNELLPDPQLGLLLALRAYGTSPTTQARAAVRAAAGASTVRGYLRPLHPQGAYDLFCPANTSGPGVFDPSGQYVAVTCHGYVEVWRWASRSGPGSADRPYAVHPGGSPSGAVFSRSGNQILFAGPGGQIYQWTWRTQHLQVIGRGFSNAVILPSPAGILVASESGQKVAITNLSNGSVSSIRPPCCSYASPSLDNPPFVFNPAGTELAVLTIRNQNQQSQADTLSVFDLRDGAQIFSRTVPNATLPIALSSGGRVAVAVLESAKVFSVAHPAQPPVVDNLVSPAGLPAHCCDVDAPLAMAWSPDGRALAVGSEDLWTRVWLPGSATPFYLDDSSGTGSNGVAFSPDGQYLLTSGFDTQVWQWRASAPMSVPATGLVLGTAVSPDGQTFAVAESDNKILLWDWRTSQLRTLTLSDSHAAPGSDNFAYLAFSPDGHNLVSAGPDDYLRTWSLSSLTRISEVRLPGAPASVAFSPDGSYLGVAWIGGVARWSTAGGTSKPLVIPQPNNEGGLILSLSNTGAMQMLVNPSLHGRLSLTGELIDAAAGSDRPTPVAQVGLPVFPGATGTLLPGHRLLVCGSECYLYAIGSHSVKRLPAPALKDQTRFSLSTDRHIVYLADLGGVISAWDLRPSDPAVKVTTAAAAMQAGATPSDLLLASQSSLQLLPTAPYQAFPAVLRIARSEAVRALTPAERREYLAGAQGG